MTVDRGQTKLTYEELEALYDERETLLHALHQQVHALELERDEVRHGLDILTEAMRRRGCCDHDADGHAL